MCIGGTVCMGSELLGNLLCHEENLLCHEEGVGDDICAEGGDSLYTGNQGGGGILVTIFWTKSASNCEVYSSYNHMSSINEISVDPLYFNWAESIEPQFWWILLGDVYKKNVKFRHDQNPELFPTSLKRMKMT